jgi:hypothetical protein
MGAENFFFPMCPETHFLSGLVDFLALRNSDKLSLTILRVGFLLPVGKTLLCHGENPSF